MRKALVLFLIGLVILSAGCASQTPETTPTSTEKSTTPTSQTSTSTTETTASTTSAPTTTTTTTTTATPTKTYVPIDFKKARRGEVVGNWDELFDTSTIYVSADLVDLAKHYFPNVEIRPSYEFQRIFFGCP